MMVKMCNLKPDNFPFIVFYSLMIDALVILSLSDIQYHYLCLGKCWVTDMLSRWRR